MSEKNKGGRPPHKPTDQQRKQVESLIGFGVTQENIANMIGIERKTLEKHYRAEIDSGVTKANAAVAQSLYRKATGDGASAVTAAIFWLKTRAQWKETTAVEHSGPEGGPIRTERIERTVVDPSNTNS